jgi:hypothetical protein
MVKNAGDIFEDILNENLHLVDRYTFLDTGSTDNTINIIKKVMAKKKGALYQEPFVNFRESRNRCLDLAGNSCKFNLMLDDTYVVKGDLRKFLTEVRGDQFFDSYSFLIKGHDLEYTTCRITKSEKNLRYMYKIHEIIQSNNSGLIPIETNIRIEDYNNKYMEDRTFSRKEYDLKMLFEMVEEEPDNPRHLYYIAQTYNILKNHLKAAEYFLKRIEHHVKGEITELCDSYFELARIYNYFLDKEWDICEHYYLKSWELVPQKPDCLYYIALHYFNIDKQKSFEWFKKALECGYSPEITQHSIRPTIFFTYIPYFLCQLCYLFKDFELGKKVCDIFLSSKWNASHEYYNTMIYWKKTFTLINTFNSQDQLKEFCIVADGGWDNWDGSHIIDKGVGGSETYIIELARNLKKLGYNTTVFCRTQTFSIVDGVEYHPINNYLSFIKTHKIKNLLVSRYTEYLPVSFLANIENVYLCLHDVPINGNIIILDQKFKKIFCMSEYQAELYSNYFPMLKNIIKVHGLGIDEHVNKNIKKIKHKFIYSSFANRGLLPLLQLWPNIKNRYKDATLHIYTDISLDSNAGIWVNNVYKEGVEAIKTLLRISEGIEYHGWVNKQTLQEAWLSSDIWLYPCIFNETFCLTALEAAITKTLAITTDLAALKETVGDRGVLLDIIDINDPLNPEWRLKTLPKIFEAIENNEKRNDMIERNYEWAKKLTWENKTKQFLQNL